MGGNLQEDNPKVIKPIDIGSSNSTVDDFNKTVNELIEKDGHCDSNTNLDDITIESSNEQKVRDKEKNR